MPARAYTLVDLPSAVTPASIEDEPDVFRMTFLPFTQTHSKDHGHAAGLAAIRGLPLFAAIGNYLYARGVEPAVPGVIHDALEANLRGLQGEYEPGEEGARKRASDALTVAGLALTGGIGSTAAGLVPKNSLGTFAGWVGARNLAKAGRPTALQALSLAKTMELRGSTAAEIRAATNELIARADPKLGGVSKGADGQWRVEINDKGASKPTHWGTGTMGEMLPHPELEAAYPREARVPTEIVKGEDLTKGYYRYGRGRRLFVKDDSKSHARETALHERQHGIQAREGFARGGTPDAEDPTKSYVHLEASLPVAI